MKKRIEIDTIRKTETKLENLGTPRSIIDIIKKQLLQMNFVSIMTWKPKINNKILFYLC